MTAEPKIHPAVKAYDIVGISNALRNQRRIDAEGDEVGISRQAADEAAALCEHIPALIARVRELEAENIDLKRKINILCNKTGALSYGWDDPDKLCPKDN